MAAAPSKDDKPDMGEKGIIPRAQDVEPTTDAEAANAPPRELSTTNQYPSGLRLTLIVASLCLAIFLTALDQTILSPALATITDEFSSVRDIGWYGSSYLLTTTALQPLYGTIYRQFPVKPAFMGAVGLFELGSLVCALAPTSRAFIVGRAVAGLGGAGIFSGCVVILSLSVPLRKRPMFYGAFGSMWGIASVAGPLLGGAFAQRLTWRWCFWINLPLGGVALGVIFFFLHIPKQPGSRNVTDGSASASQDKDNSVMARLARLDLLGATTLVGAIVMMLLGLEWGGSTYPWKSGHVIGMFCGASVMALCFGAVEWWKGDKALLPPRFLTQRNIVCAMCFNFFFGSCFFAIIYYLGTFSILSYYLIFILNRIPPHLLFSFLLFFLFFLFIFFFFFFFYICLAFKKNKKKKKKKRKGKLT
jgi:MFS family permease